MLEGQGGEAVRKLERQPAVNHCDLVRSAIGGGTSGAARGHWHLTRIEEHGACRGHILHARRSRQVGASTPRVHALLVLRPGVPSRVAACAWRWVGAGPAALGGLVRRVHGGVFGGGGGLPAPALA